MRHAAAVTCLLLGACVSGSGQKVTVLLTNRTVTCVDAEEGGRTATLELDQPEDFYLAEFLDRDTGQVRVLSATRVGTTVTFPCLAGISEFVVRHATVLQARRETGGEPAPTRVDTAR